MLVPSDIYNADIYNEKPVCAVERLRVICCEAVNGMSRPSHTELERAVFTIEILSCLYVYLGMFMQLPSIVVKTKSQTSLKKLF